MTISRFNRRPRRDRRARRNSDESVEVLPVETEAERAFLARMDELERRRQESKVDAEKRAAKDKKQKPPPPIRDPYRAGDLLSLLQQRKVATLTRKDPPRMAEDGSLYYGNPIDGTAYYLFLERATLKAPHYITKKDVESVSFANTAHLATALTSLSDVGLELSAGDIKRIVAAVQRGSELNLSSEQLMQLKFRLLVQEYEREGKKVIRKRVSQGRGVRVGSARAAQADLSWGNAQNYIEERNGEQYAFAALAFVSRQADTLKKFFMPFGPGDNMGRLLRPVVSDIANETAVQADVAVAKAFRIGIRDAREFIKSGMVRVSPHKLRALEADLTQKEVEELKTAVKALNADAVETSTGSTSLSDLEKSAAKARYLVASTELVPVGWDLMIRHNSKSNSAFFSWVPDQPTLGPAQQPNTFAPTELQVRASALLDGLAQRVRRLNNSYQRVRNAVATFEDIKITSIRSFDKLYASFMKRIAFAYDALVTDMANFYDWSTQLQAQIKQEREEGKQDTPTQLMLEALSRVFVEGGSVYGKHALPPKIEFTLEDGEEREVEVRTMRDVVEFIYFGAKQQEKLGFTQLTAAERRTLRQGKKFETLYARDRKAMLLALGEVGDSITANDYFSQRLDDEFGAFYRFLFAPIDSRSFLTSYAIDVPHRGVMQKLAKMGVLSGEAASLRPSAQMLWRKLDAAHGGTKALHEIVDDRKKTDALREAIRTESEAWVLRAEGLPPISGYRPAGLRDATYFGLANKDESGLNGFEYEKRAKYIENARNSIRMDINVIGNTVKNLVGQGAIRPIWLDKLWFIDFAMREYSDMINLATETKLPDGETRASFVFSFDDVTKFISTLLYIGQLYYRNNGFYLGGSLSDDKSLAFVPLLQQFDARVENIRGHIFGHHTGNTLYPKDPRDEGMHLEVPEVKLYPRLGDKGQSFDVYRTYNPLLFQITSFFWPREATKTQSWNGFFRNTELLRQVDQVGRTGYLLAIGQQAAFASMNEDDDFPAEIEQLLFGDADTRTALDKLRAKIEKASQEGKDEDSLALTYSLANALQRTDNLFGASVLCPFGDPVVVAIDEVETIASDPAAAAAEMKAQMATILSTLRTLATRGLPRQSLGPRVADGIVTAGRKKGDQARGLTELEDIFEGRGPEARPLFDAEDGIQPLSPDARDRVLTALITAFNNLGGKTFFASRLRIFTQLQRAGKIDEATAARRIDTLEKARLFAADGTKAEKHVGRKYRENAYAALLVYRDFRGLALTPRAVTRELLQQLVRDQMPPEFKPDSFSPEEWREQAATRPPSPIPVEQPGNEPLVPTALPARAVPVSTHHGLVRDIDAVLSQFNEIENTAKTKAKPNTRRKRR
jgi:hypothetical protein